MISLGVEAARLYALAQAAKSKEELHEIERALWRNHGEGRCNDSEAQELAERIAQMKGNNQVGRSVGAVVARLGSRFASRQRPRCPNRAAARARRRQLGGSSALPDMLRQHYTEGQRAVLCIVAGEVKAKGHCDMPIDKICALAGVCRTTVQTTLHEARLLGHIIVKERPQPGRKSLTNVVEVISREWLVWIKRGSHRVARDRVQFVRTIQKCEPHEEVRGIEEGRECAAGGASARHPRPASALTVGRRGVPLAEGVVAAVADAQEAARKGDSVSPFVRGRVDRQGAAA